MSAYSNFNDRPYQINIEGQDITITFNNNGDGTGTINWNIPTPANGCTAENQAYNGILITLSTTAADYITTSPSNGFIYSADPTADPNLFTGDMLNTAMVVGAFYNNKTTTSLTVTGLQNNAFYYISGYAVDNVGRYYREGVHSYSLASGVEKIGKNATSAYQDIGINAPAEVHLKDPTNLAPNIDYTLHFRTNSNFDAYTEGENVTAFYGRDYVITIPGREALSYEMLINTLNNKFKLLDNPYQGPEPPNAGTYYFNNETNILYYFDGFNLIQQNALISRMSPLSPVDGNYWYNPSTQNIFKYVNNSWSQQPLTIYNFDYTNPSCGTLWFNGTTAYEWSGTIWYELPTYIQSFNPLLPPQLSCNTYWYNENTSFLYQWNPGVGGWEAVQVIDSPYDPRTIKTGSLWLNTTNSVLNQFVGGKWINVNYRTDEPVNNTLSNPSPGVFWLNPQNNQLFQRNSLNTAWTMMPYIISPVNPVTINSGTLWWNQSPSVDTLYVWDTISDGWIIVEQFIRSYTDPSLAPNISSNAAWYNPQTGILQYLANASCTTVSTVFTPFAPTMPPTGVIWYNPTTLIFNIRENDEWVPITPFIWNADPYNLYPSYIWFDTSTQTLNVWNGTEFLQSAFTTTDPTPALNTEWYNTLTQDLSIWQNSQWMPQLGKVIVNLNKPDIFNYLYTSYLRFMTRDTGCDIFFEIIPQVTGLFTYVRPDVIYHNPVPGGSSLDAGPTYNQLGVGKDGSPDMRRQIQSEIRGLLGAPSVVVELTKEQLDTCIDYALMTLRKYSSLAYRRFMFFIDMQPNQQIYYLTNKCVGFNKITQVNGIFRLKSAFFRTGFAGNDMFGFAALQQLYTIGSFDMVSFHLMTQYIEVLEQLFATKVMYQFVEEKRELRLYQAITYKERMLVDANIEKTEQQLFDYRETAIWLRKWTLAEAKKMLSEVRGKYATLPGPNGSTTLNASALASEAAAEMESLMKQIYDQSMQALDDQGERAHFIQG